MVIAVEVWYTEPHEDVVCVKYTHDDLSKVKGRRPPVHLRAPVYTQQFSLISVQWKREFGENSNENDSIYLDDFEKGNVIFWKFKNKSWMW